METINAEEYYISTKSKEFEDMFGRLHYVKDWARVCKLFVGKVPEGGKERLVEEVEDFLTKNPLPIIVGLYEKENAASEREKQERVAARKAEKEEASPKEKEKAPKEKEKAPKNKKRKLDLKEAEESVSKEPVYSAKKRVEAQPTNKEDMISDGGDQPEYPEDYDSEEEISMEAGLWNLIFPSNAFEEPISVEKRKIILDRYPSFKQHPLDAPGVLKAFKSDLGGAAKYRESEYIFLQRRILDVWKPIEHLATYLAEKLPEEHEEWGRMLRDTVRLLMVPQSQLTQLRKENVARAEGGQPAVNLVKPQPKGGPLFTEENQQTIKNVKKLKTAMQESKKTRDARFAADRKFFRGQKGQQQRGDSSFRNPRGAGRPYSRYGRGMFRGAYRGRGRGQVPSKQ
jgi:hypothetical protein